MQENVLRLKVSMDNVFLVNIVQTKTNLEKEFPDSAFCQMLVILKFEILS